MMLDRIKFIFGFARAYRNARKSGSSRDDAKLAAASRMLDERFGISSRRPAVFDLPPEAAELWTDPEPAFQADDTYFGFGPFEVTAQHIALLREIRFAWDGAERGAPMLDPERPYGREDLVRQLGENFGEEDLTVLARRHVEMFYVLGRFLSHAALAPGHIALRNVTGDDLRSALKGYGEDEGLSDADIGIGPDGLVVVTEEHLKLLREMSLEWPSQSGCEDRIDMSTYPAAAIDPKRPYGDYTYIEVDMARILGRLPPRPEGTAPAVFEPEPELAAHLQRLHWQMLGVVQAFVENAELPPGTYER